MDNYRGKLIGVGLGWLAGGLMGTILGATLGHWFDKEEAPPEDPYSVLGLERSASQEEIKKRYLELSSKYHPDKVSHLGEELIDLAERKFVEINKSYQTIRKERGL